MIDMGDGSTGHHDVHTGVVMAEYRGATGVKDFQSDLKLYLKITGSDAATVYIDEKTGVLHFEV